jgi:hypothetical protein
MTKANNKISGYISLKQIDFKLVVRFDYANNKANEMPRPANEEQCKRQTEQVFDDILKDKKKLLAKINVIPNTAYIYDNKYYFIFSCEPEHFSSDIVHKTILVIQQYIIDNKI